MMMESVEPDLDHGLELQMDVFVESRTWPGINKPGGFGKVAKVNDDGTVDVR